MNNKIKGIFPILYEINKILIQKGRVSRRELAETFEVSKRTITNYINVLSRLGAPIKSSNNGYEYEHAFNLEPINKELLIMYTLLLKVMDNKNIIPLKFVDIFKKNIENYIASENYINLHNHIEFISNTNTSNSKLCDKIEIILDCIILKKMIYVEISGKKNIIEPHCLINNNLIWGIIGYNDITNELIYTEINKILKLKKTEVGFKREFSTKNLDNFISKNFYK